MNEGAALRVLSFLNDASAHHVASLVNEKRKVTVIGEEHEPEEFQKEEPSSSVINEEIPLLTPKQIEAFFKAAEDGSIKRLEDLFESIANANPNMTNYTESLLMAAIRAKRRKVAEYLIDQLAINVNHTTELIEFRVQSQIPVRERTISCRDLAYQRGMMDLVDLIDMTSDDVKPNVKRYLQRRLKVRLEEIHQGYLKRMKERSRRLMVQTQERENKLFEDDELEKENEEASPASMKDGTSLPSTPLGAPVSHPSYKSHIEETIRKIESRNDKSIDETGKKNFRFSGYTLRYRLVESANTNQQKNERSRSKLTSFPLPTTTTPLFRPMTTATTPDLHLRSISVLSAQIPIREKRTSICRSARRIPTPRIAPTINTESKPEVKSPIKTSSDTTQRLLPKRMPRINTSYGYIPQVQHALYNEPRRSMPVTLKSTAIGLPSDTRIIRD